MFGHGKFLEKSWKINVEKEGAPVIVSYAVLTTTIRLRFDGCRTEIRLLINGH